MTPKLKLTLTVKNGLGELSELYKIKKHEKRIYTLSPIYMPFIKSPLENYHYFEYTLAKRPNLIIVVKTNEIPQTRS